MSSQITVRKYGGSSLSSIEKIKNVAKSLVGLNDRGQKVIVVVSAMGKSTDELMQLAYSISSQPPPRELDMLISTGERISMSLLSMALHELHCPAISFTGSQAGILTDSSHSQAKIVEIKPTRVQEELDKGRVIVIAGFQGVSPATKEVTTLGRGGSDTSAVALAAHFKAETCEVLKDVPGVLSLDPTLGLHSRPIPEISYEHLHHMTHWGSKILHHRSVSLAQRLNVPLTLGLAHGQGDQTLVRENGALMYESTQVLAISSKEGLLCANTRESSLHKAHEQLRQAMTAGNIGPVDPVHVHRRPDGWSLWISPAPEHTSATHQALQEHGIRLDSAPWFAITLTGYGVCQSTLPQSISEALESFNVEIQHLIMAPQGLTLLLQGVDLKETIKVILETCQKQKVL